MKTTRKLLTEAVKLQGSLRTKFVGTKILWFDKLSSTQQFAKRLISTNGISAANGVVIISNRQRNGIGRHGNRWVSPRGGIWLSIILSPKLHPSNITLFSFCASVAVSEAIDRSVGTTSRLKWPNDVLIQGMKVSGVLIDASVTSDYIDHMIVGIGVNANVKAAQIEREIGREQTYPVSSLQEQLGTTCNTEELTNCILQTFDEYYCRIEANNGYPILEKWKERAEPIISKSVQISRGGDLFAAKVVDLDEDGSLIIIRGENRIEKIVAAAEYRVRVSE